MPQSTIASECSSHFKAAYHDYRKEDYTYSEDASSSEKSRSQSHLPPPQSKRNYSQSESSTISGTALETIPTIVNQSVIPHDDVFQNLGGTEEDEDQQPRTDQPLNSCDVPNFWKKDIRRKSNVEFLSPIHMDRLDKQHQKLSPNPDSFTGLRQLSARLQDQRRLSRDRFDSDFSQSTGSDGEGEDVVEDEIIDFSNLNLSPRSNMLLQRRRLLDITGNDVHKEPGNPRQEQNNISSLKDRRMSVDNFLSPPKQNLRGRRKLSMITKKTSLPKIELGGYIINQPNAGVKLGRKGSNGPQRSFSLSQQPSFSKLDQGIFQVSELNEPPKSRQPSPASPMMSRNIVRRASRIISKAEQSLMEKELNFLASARTKASDSEDKEPLKELKHCRYLRTAIHAENSEDCPCNTCERNRFNVT